MESRAQRKEKEQGERGTGTLKEKPRCKGLHLQVPQSQDPHSQCVKGVSGKRSQSQVGEASLRLRILSCGELRGSLK